MVVEVPPLFSKFKIFTILVKYTAGDAIPAEMVFFNVHLIHPNDFNTLSILKLVLAALSMVPVLTSESGISSGRLKKKTRLEKFYKKETGRSKGWLEDNKFHLKMLKMLVTFEYQKLLRHLLVRSHIAKNFMLKINSKLEWVCRTDASLIYFQVCGRHHHV